MRAGCPKRRPGTGSVPSSVLAQSKLLIEGRPQPRRMNQVLSSADVPTPVGQDLHHTTTALNTGMNAGQTEQGRRDVEPSADDLPAVPEEISWPGLERWEPWGSERLPDSMFD